MKKLLSLIFCAFCILHSAFTQGTMDIYGVTRQIDTVEYKQVGSGTMYCYARMPELSQEFHVLTIDLENQYTEIETFLGKDCIAGTELVTSACNRHTREGHDAYCGVNGDFFNVSSNYEYPLGMPRGGSIQNGEVQVAPSNESWFWAFATVDVNKKPVLDYMIFNARVIIDENNTYHFNRVNQAWETSDLTLYNRFAGEKTRPYENHAGFDTMERTEVVVELVKGEKWGLNKRTKVKVRRIVKNIDGGEPIAADETVLSGVRAAATFLDQLSVGQELEVEMAIFCSDASQPLVEQLIGGNAMILQNGELTERNTGDSYNSMPYPRTAIGASQDGRWLYLFVCDGKGVGGSAGLTTTEVCGILKNVGAYNIVGMDGGGSAEMVVNHAIVNKPADGNERSVGNGWMLVSTAPVDTMISYLRFHKHKLNIPTYASFVPRVMAYNQYGALLDDDVQGFILECDENIGVCEGNTFIATSTEAKGNLTVKLGDIEYTAPLQVVFADVVVRLDSVIVDQNIDYAIEVLSGDMLVDPAAFDWTIDNPEIVSIDENGIMNGLQNGRTIVRCELGGKSDSLIVISEVNDTIGDILFDSCGLKSSSTKWNTTLVPATATDNAKLTFTFSAARAPYIQLLPKMRLYSLPKQIVFTFNPNDVKIQSVLVDVLANNALSSVVLEFNDIELNMEQALIVDIAETFGANDIAIYPLFLNYFKFNISADTEKKEHVIDIKSLQLIYDEVIVEIEDVIDMNDLVVYPSPATDYIVVEGREGEDVKVYDLDGRCLRQFVMHNTKSVIDVSSLPVGTYIIKSNAASCKMIIK
ncbi:MAG: phosphodiester glycosidase family protein [Paludibacteraceae bacterium]|nr:phosphodiester glycosidase family protein [Paludibacteraceae bacterium]